MIVSSFVLLFHALATFHPRTWTWIPISYPWLHQSIIPSSWFCFFCCWWSRPHLTLEQKLLILSATPDPVLQLLLLVLRLPLLPLVDPLPILNWIHLVRLVKVKQEYLLSNAESSRIYKLLGNKGLKQKQGNNQAKCISSVLNFSIVSFRSCFIPKISSPVRV